MNYELFLEKTGLRPVELRDTFKLKTKQVSHEWKTRGAVPYKIVLTALKMGLLDLADVPEIV